MGFFRRLAADRRVAPTLESLEGRRLLTAGSTANQVAYVRHKYHEYAGELQHLELRSQATPAESLALRDDARALSQAAATTSLPLTVARQKAAAASLQLDRSPLDGSLTDQGWADVKARLAANLDGLNVSPAQLDQTIADMKAIAQSAGVSLADYNDLAAKADSYRDNRDRLGNTSYHFPDPGLYYSQHLRGFFRGGARQRSADRSKLDADLAGFPPPEKAVLRRAAQDLERIGGALTTSAFGQLSDDLIAVLSGGPPTAQALGRLQAEYNTALGATPPAAAHAAVDRFFVDAPAFFPAAATAPDQARAIVRDVQAVVADGVGSPLNPFKIQV